MNGREVMRVGGGLVVVAAVVVALAVDWGTTSAEAPKGPSSEANCAGNAPPPPGVTGAFCARTPGAPAAAEAAPKAAAPARNPPTVVEVVSRTCSACKRMQPVVDKVTHGCPGSVLKVERRWVDDDEGADFARRHAIFGVPTLLLLDEQGREVSRLIGEQTLAVLEGAMRDLSGGRCGS